MILAVDVGNTNITFGLYERFDIAFSANICTNKNETVDQLAAEFSSVLGVHGADSSLIDGAIISSVVPQLTFTVRDALAMIANVSPYIVGLDIPENFKILIDNPNELGADLIAGAAGAIKKYNLPCLVVDMGTATKMSVIDKNCAFRGCAIAPGIGLSLKALTNSASLLSDISLNAPRKALGTNTKDSMQSGLILGAAAMIEGLAVRLEESLGSEIATIVATGGYASSVIPSVRLDLIYDKNLVLDGLNYIYSDFTGLYK